MMTTGPDVSAEFQRRRLQTWKSIRWWLLLALIAGIAFARGPLGSDLEMTQGQFTFMLVSFSVVCIAMIAAIRIVAANYRCPNCNSMPMRSMSGGGGGISYRTGVDLNPSTCPKCGAQLQ
ncbi:MAG: hypothetical protein ACREVG_06750 [Burkholderiales bacterium]